MGDFQEQCKSEGNMLLIWTKYWGSLSFLLFIIVHAVRSEHPWTFCLNKMVFDHASNFRVATEGIVWCYCYFMCSCVCICICIFCICVYNCIINDYLYFFVFVFTSCLRSLLLLCIRVSGILSPTKSSFVKSSISSFITWEQDFFHFHFHEEQDIFTLSLSSPSRPCCSRLVGEVPFPHPLHTFHPPNKLRHLGFGGKEILWKGEAIWYIAIVTEYRIHSSVFVIPKKVDITS